MEEKKKNKLGGLALEFKDYRCDILPSFLSEGNKREAARRLPLTFLSSFPPFLSSPPPLWWVMMEVNGSPPACQKLPGHNFILAKHSCVIFRFLKVVSGIFYRFQEKKGQENRDGLNYGFVVFRCLRS